MPNSTPTLDELRARIDAIDDGILDLLAQRTAIVEHVAREKQASGGIPALRPGREAAILRRLYARHKGPFPVGPVLRIWRELISGQLAVQTDFAVAVFVPGGAAGFWDLARDHFGSHTPMTPFRSVGQVIRAVGEGVATVGILPVPEEGERDPWWRALVATDEATPRVFARLPFGPRGNARREGGDAVAIGVVAPEPTGADRSLIVIETHGDVSRARLFSTLAACGLPCTFYAAFEARREASLGLAEVEGFVAPNDPRIKSFIDQVGGPIDRILTIGAYPVPIPEAAT